MCGRRSRSLLFVAYCVLLALLLVATAPVMAQETLSTEPQSQSETQQSPQGTLSWDDLVTASQALSQSADESVTQAEDLSSQLSGLQYSLTQSQMLLQASIEKGKQADQAFLSKMEAKDRELLYSRIGNVALAIAALLAIGAAIK